MSVIPVRTEIEVIPADPVYVSWENKIVRTPRNKIVERHKRLQLGWTITETIGVAVVNTRGVAAGKKSVIIGE